MKIAVFVPGIGYNTERPLLYYPRKMARAMGYELIQISFDGLKIHLYPSHEEMEQVFYDALDQAEAQLADVDFKSAERVIFFGKSIGSIVAASYARDHCPHTGYVAFTPLEDTFMFAWKGIAFHGSNDELAENNTIMAAAAVSETQMFVVPDANHSLETGDIDTDIVNLRTVMAQVKDYFETYDRTGNP